ASATMDPKGNNEYTVELSIKDSINFYLAAEDFASERKKITLVPPPRIVGLQSVENRPAYLYHMYYSDDVRRVENHVLPSVYASSLALMPAPGNPLTAAAALPAERPYDDDKYSLGHRKQRGEPHPVNVAGEVKPKIRVPAGSDVELLADTDKDILV